MLVSWATTSCCSGLSTMAAQTIYNQPADHAMLVEQVPPSRQQRKPASQRRCLSVAALECRQYFISFHFISFISANRQSNQSLCAIEKQYSSPLRIHHPSIILLSSMQLLKGMPWQLQQSLAAATEPHTHPEPRTSAAKPASCSGKGGLERGICPSSISRLWSPLPPSVIHVRGHRACRSWRR